MTKAEKIRQTAAKYPQLNSIQLGERLGVRDGYVRAVLSRQRGGGVSKAERDRVARWKAAHPEKQREFQRLYHARKKAEREASHA